MLATSSQVAVRFDELFNVPISNNESVNKSMSLFDRVSTQLLAFEQNLESARDALANLNRDSNSPPTAHGSRTGNPSTFGPDTDTSVQKQQLLEQMPTATDIALSSVVIEFEQSVQNLRRDIGQLNLLYEITSQCDGALTLEDVIKATLELVWQKAPLTFAVAVLGEEELGPYHYQGMMGVAEQWRYLKGECAFPLSGVLSRALLNRLDPTEPDYLYISDIETEGRPLPNEFPWMTLRGSLLILPLRLHTNAIGALILGRQESNAFADTALCDDFREIAENVAKSVHSARLQHEVNKNVEQLVNVQLLTQEIARAKTFDAVINTLTRRVPEVMGPVNVQVFMHKWGVTADAQGGTLPVNGFMVSGSDDLEDSSKTDTGSPFVRFGTDDEKLRDTSEIYRLLKWSMESGEAVFYDPDAMNDHLEYSYYTDSGSAMIVPMMTSDEAIGVIRVQALDHLLRFDESDMFVLRTIANSVWLALKHVLFLEEQQTKRLTDLRSLAETLEIRIPQLSGHHTRVTHNAALVAEHLTLSDEACRAIQTSATLHDIGSLQLSDKALQELCLPLQILDSNQQNLIQKSSKYLSQIGVDNEVVGMIAQMAEPFAQVDYSIDAPRLEPALISATGVPDLWHPHPTFSEPDTQPESRLCHQVDKQPDQRISLRIASTSETTDAMIEIGARIVAVVDAFDHALCSDPNRNSVNSQIVYLSQHSGSLFAPQIVQTFLSLIEQELILLPQ